MNQGKGKRGGGGGESPRGQLGTYVLLEHMKFIKFQWPVLLKSYCFVCLFDICIRTTAVVPQQD